jgi:hypothetical protein
VYISKNRDRNICNFRLKKEKKEIIKKTTSRSYPGWREDFSPPPVAILSLYLSSPVLISSSRALQSSSVHTFVIHRRSLSMEKNLAAVHGRRFRRAVDFFWRRSYPWQHSSLARAYLPLCSLPFRSSQPKSMALGTHLLPLPVRRQKRPAGALLHRACSLVLPRCALPASSSLASALWPSPSRVLVSLLCPAPSSCAWLPARVSGHLKLVGALCSLARSACASAMALHRRSSLSSTRSAFCTREFVVFVPVIHTIFSVVVVARLRAAHALLAPATGCRALCPRLARSLLVCRAHEFYLLATAC